LLISALRAWRKHPVNYILRHPSSSPTFAAHAKIKNMTEKKQPPRRTPATMYPMIARMDRSGKSQAAFARQEGMSQVVLRYWVRKYRESQRGIDGSFIEVIPPPGSPAPRQGGVLPATCGVFARLLLPDGIELHIHQNVPGAYLREILGW
jgi:hypothetical protein